MRITKRGEWERACADFSDLSPFVLLKLSMVRYGAVLSPNALSRLQDPFIPLVKAEPLASALKGGRRSFRCPGQFCCGMVPLYTLITGKGLKIPMTSSIIRSGAFSY